MQDFTNLVESLEDFKKEHISNLIEINNKIKESYCIAYELIGIKSTEEGFIEIEESIQKLSYFDFVGDKITAMRKLKSRIEKEIKNKVNKAVDDEKIEKAIDKLMKDFDEIVEIIKSADKRIIQEAKKKIDLIFNCPFGQEENKEKIAFEFEKNIVELLSWLFIDEIRLLTKDELKEESLKRDGVFKVENNFDFNRRNLDKFKFSHIICECKNYSKPSYRDLMQVYAYTLLNKIFPLVNKPLCLIISRENPTEESITLKMRDKLFEKSFGGSLLVLFLNCNDLREMCEKREKSCDPFQVLNRHIEVIFQRNVTIET